MRRSERTDVLNLPGSGQILSVSLDKPDQVNLMIMWNSATFRLKAASFAKAMVLIKMQAKCDGKIHKR